MFGTMLFVDVQFAMDSGAFQCAVYCQVGNFLVMQFVGGECFMFLVGFSMCFSLFRWEPK